eukprot:GHVH01015004.1.p1 GENE.GHVH01015004.1~~GHVH01015004.1.p1  ORF type:complete len:430 (-),score=41.47 GHVH01015004.1:1820-3109(-)
MLVQPEHEEFPPPAKTNTNPFPHELFQTTQAEQSRMLMMQQMCPPSIPMIPPHIPVTKVPELQIESDAYVMDIDALVNSTVEKWHVANVCQAIPDNFVADAVAFALMLSQGSQSRLSILSITKTFNGEFYDMYVVIRSRACFAPSTLAISVKGIMMSASKIANISDKVLHLSDSDSREDWLTPVEILAGYLLESLCLGCERIGHTQPQCKKSAFSCPNCKGSHAGVECDKACRFCEVHHPGKSVMFCLRQVAHYHRTNRNVGTILGSVNIPETVHQANNCIKSPSGSIDVGDSTNAADYGYGKAHMLAGTKMIKEYPHKVIVSGLPSLGGASSILKVINNALALRGKATRLIRKSEPGVKQLLSNMADDEGVVLFDNHHAMEYLISQKKIRHIGLQFSVRPVLASWLESHREAGSSQAVDENIAAINKP